MSGALIFVVALVVVALVLVFAGVKTVSQGTNWTIERFGRYTRTLPPGLHLIVPFVDTVGRKMNMQENVLDIPPQKVITKDNASVQVDAVAFYQVIDAARAAYEVQNLHLAITNLALTNIRSVMGNMALDEALSKRNDINNTLLSVIDQATSPWGVKVLRIEVKDIAPPEDIVVAMGRQMKAEREKRATILEAEGVRESSIQRAEGEKQSAILTAEGRREAAFRDAEARERLAEAEAKATAVVAQAIAGNGVQATNYFLGTKYVEALAKMGSSTNSKVFFLPVEAAGDHGLDRRHRRTRQGSAGARRRGRGGPAARLGSQHGLRRDVQDRLLVLVGARGGAARLRDDAAGRGLPVPGDRRGGGRRVPAGRRRTCRSNCSSSSSRSSPSSRRSALRPTLQRLQRPQRPSQRSTPAATAWSARPSCSIAPILGGRGRVKLGDGSWTVTGPDMVAGAAGARGCRQRHRACGSSRRPRARPQGELSVPLPSRKASSACSCGASLKPCAAIQSSL